MSGEISDYKLIAGKGDIIICLDTGSIGVVLEVRAADEWLVCFPHGNYVLGLDDFDVLKSG